MKKIANIIMTEDELKSLKKSLKYVKGLKENKRRKNENKSNRRIA